MRNTLVAIGLSLSLALGGCANNEQSGQLIGALGGAGIGAGLGRAIGGNRTGALLGAALGAAGGALIGGAIGRNLDERDRQLADAATYRALNAPYNPPPYPYSPAPYNIASAQPGSQAAVRPRPRPATPARGTAPAETPPATTWTSDHSGASGTVAVVNVEPAPAGGECRTLTQVAYIEGKEVKQDQKFCKLPPRRDWQKA